MAIHIFSMVFSSFACLRCLSKLANKNYIKLCADGTFKQLFANWCTIPLGFLSKRRGRTTLRGLRRSIKTWPTTFTPLLWIVASGETEGAYTIGARVLDRFAANTKIAGIDLEIAVKQFHCDMTATAEAARKKYYRCSIRCNDR